MRFTGTIGYVDRTSDKPPIGSRGHLVCLTREAVQNALHTLVGTLINASADFRQHAYGAEKAIGIITEALIVDDKILVGGKLFTQKLLVRELCDLCASVQEFGMSYEAQRTFVENTNADIYVVRSIEYFQGAAVILRECASCRDTFFTIHK